MSNLIITLLGIILVAVAAAVGVFYGGTIYTSYLAQTKASEILNDIQQMKVAAYAWRGDNALSDSPVTDPTGLVTNCQGSQAPQNAIVNSLQACWIDALTNNGQYLSSSWFYPTYTDLSGSQHGSSVDAIINTGLTFGPYGACHTNTSDGFYRCYFKISAANYPTTPYLWTIVFSISAASYNTDAGATNGISTIQATEFIFSLCHKINQAIGQELPNGTYPNLPAGVSMNNSNITGTTYPINLPEIPSGYTTNVCVTIGNAGNANVIYYYSTF